MVIQKYGRKLIETPFKSAGGTDNDYCNEKYC